MTDLPSYDQDLLSRLNALRQSSITLDTREPSLSVPKTRPTPETDLASRLRSLRDGVITETTLSKSAAAVAGPSKTHGVSRAATFRPDIVFTKGEDDLQPRVSDDEPSKLMNLETISKIEVQSALDGARKVLAQGTARKIGLPKNLSPATTDKTLLAAPPSQNYRTAISEPSSPDGSEDESREAEDIITQLLDELELERKEGVTEAIDEDANVDTKDVDANDKNKHPDTTPQVQNHDLDLPGVPVQDPEPEPTPETFESNMTARMAALRNLGGGFNSLGLPSAPTSKPASTPAKKPNSIPFGFIVVEEEYWCAICHADATVVCHGCGDDTLYCARCWKEEHMGPDAGLEERRHEWSKYKRPRS